MDDPLPAPSPAPAGPPARGPDVGPVAIGFAPDAVVAAGRPRLMGRHAAGSGFLGGMIRHGGMRPLTAYLLERATGAAFARVAQDLGAEPPVAAIPPDRLDLLARSGALTLPDPRVADAAHRRSLAGAAAYAITGVTHTTATLRAMAALADMATAPVQPWDALVCTSRAVLAQVRAVLDAEEDALRARLGASRFVRPMLPVIPLGVDAAALAPRPEHRSAWRARLGIAEADVAVLYLGRLSRATKADPLPMFAALGRAAARLPRAPHLILAGWFHGGPAEEAAWRAQAAALCPGVALHVLDGREPPVQAGIRAAADLFTLLPDNPQETFGLAPLEAMAAGLPVVAADWDGYRDTVRHGEDGFLVPTVMTAPGTGARVARLHATEAVDYATAMRLTGRLVAVDVGAAAEAYAALAADPALRRRMGAAGRERARALFDWSAVIPRYLALWAEQRALREAAADAPAAHRPSPRLLEPTIAFAAWPSRRLHRGLELRLAARPTPEELALLAGMSGFGGRDRPPLALGTMLRLLSALEEAGGAAPARALLDGLPEGQRRHAGPEALAWLAKVGVLSPA